MTADHHHYRLLRLTLEAASAHAIHSGQGDLTHDVLLVRDANGLPAIPGTSLAGVLRHRFAETHGSEAARRVFGMAGGRSEESWVSRLQVGWGLVHDSHDQPVEGLHEAPEQDELLQILADAKPLVRQRVRLNQRGSAAAEGKFDTTLMPAGVRYTTLLGYWSDGSDQAEQDWQHLLQLCRQPQLHLGHGTRAGAGRFRPVGLYLGQWDLYDPQQARAYRQRPRSRCQVQGLEDQLHTEDGTTGLSMTLSLQAEGGWRVGGGDVMQPGSWGDADNPPDLLPMHEYRILWNSGADKPRYQNCHLLPATAIKGALRHRVAYHYRCLIGAFAHGQDALPEAGDCEAVRQLFGFAEQGRAEADQQARAGVVFIEDIHIDQAKTKVVVHNRIDHFTGGVIKGGLFDEQLLWDTPITVRMHLSPAAERVEPLARKALQRTLEDLAAGWLPLGAAGSRGLGVFSDPDGRGPQWSDGGQWVAGQAATAEEG